LNYSAPVLAFKTWWPTALTPDTNQTCDSDRFHDAGSIVCDSAGRILKERFCLPFRATLRKLRPEDMFETWVSKRGEKPSVRNLMEIVPQQLYNSKRK